MSAIMEIDRTAEGSTVVPEDAERIYKDLYFYDVKNECQQLSNKLKKPVTLLYAGGAKQMKFSPQ